MTESAIMHNSMLALSQAGHLVFRTNVGKFKMADGRWFDTGLPTGFSDTFGIAADGLPYFVEFKSQTGRLRAEQKRFMETLTARNIRCGVARSVEDALNIASGVLRYSQQGV